MKITVLGAGAMGMLYGGYLSRQNEVWLVDVDEARVAKINKDGVRIREQDGTVGTYRPTAVTATDGLPPMDLIIIFVKAMYTVDALNTNKALIGPDTYLLTMQNGTGHEARLLQFADRQHVIIGTTQHNSSVIENGMINHGGIGQTQIGLLDGYSEALEPIAASFSACALSCSVSGNVKKEIWHKVFTNTAASSLTAVLQVPLDFITADENAHRMLISLCKEAVAVAAADGADFDEQTIIAEVEAVCNRAKGSYTSIYADIKNGRRTEVDTISGSVVKAGNDFGVPVPCHEMVVSIIHAMENKARLGVS